MQKVGSFFFYASVIMLITYLAQLYIADRKIIQQARNQLVQLRQKVNALHQQISSNDELIAQGSLSPFGLETKIRQELHMARAQETIFYFKTLKDIL